MQRYMHMNEPSKPIPKVAECACAGPCVHINRIEPLVKFHHYKDILLSRGLHKGT
jgi:hypothetical protein